METDLVRGAHMFAGLKEDVFERLIQQAERKHYDRGDTIFLQGDVASACFVVIDGWVKLYRLTAAGDEAVVAVFTRGQSFAEAAAFTDGVYPVSGEAATETTLLAIPCRPLIELIRRDPEVGLAMLGSTSRHLQMLVQQIEQLKAHTGAQRVAEFLISLSEAEEDRCAIGLPYDKALIAGRLGMKPESLSRVFARLRQVGVSIEHSVAVIEDMDRLRRFAFRDRSQHELDS